jgi:plastocyanin
MFAKSMDGMHDKTETENPPGRDAPRDQRVNRGARTIAGVAALLTVVYGAFEFAHFGIPERVAVGGDSNAISIFHFPLIWLLTGIMLYGAFHAVRGMRSHTVRQRPVAFGVSLVVAVILASFWAWPMVDRLTEPAETRGGAASCTKPVAATPLTGTVTVDYTAYGFCPVHVVITKGSTVKFVAAQGSSMRIASEYAAFNQKTASSQYSFTFAEVGTYPYRTGPSSTNPVKKFISEITGETQAFQGTVRVTD